MSEKLPLLSHPFKVDHEDGRQKGKHGRGKPVLVIHGGAGNMTRDWSTPEQRERYRQALRAALVKGYEVLKDGGEAMDAAVAAVGVMEGKFNHALNKWQLRMSTRIKTRLSVVQFCKRRCIQCGRQGADAIHYLYPCGY